jgi:hypothetical protein
MEFRILTDYEREHLVPFIQRAQDAQRRVELAAREAREAKTALSHACALLSGEGAWVNLRHLTLEPLPEKMAEAPEIV